jgi:hypothetical protein
MNIHLISLLALHILLSIVMPTCRSASNQFQGYRGSKVDMGVNGLPHSTSRRGKAIVLPVFECGLYWAHPANLLLCMLGDKDPAVRKEAVDKVMSLHNSPPQSQLSTSSGRACGHPLKRQASGTPVIPPYQLPKPVYDAPHYSKMIDWSVEQVIAIRSGVSKGLEDGCKPPALWGV